MEDCEERSMLMILSSILREVKRTNELLEEGNKSILESLDFILGHVDEIRCRGGCNC